MGEVFKGGDYCGEMAGGGLGGMFPMERLQAQGAGLAVGLHVHAAKERRAAQEGEAEVAELALGFGHITFYLVVVAEQALKALALDDKVIKRRKNMNLVFSVTTSNLANVLKPVVDLVRDPFHFESKELPGFAYFAQHL